MKFKYLQSCVFFENVIWAKDIEDVLKSIISSFKIMHPSCATEEAMS